MEDETEGIEDQKPDGREVISEPLTVSIPEHKHVWSFMFKDAEGRFNYKCKHCMFGRASNEEL